LRKIPAAFKAGAGQRKPKAGKTKSLEVGKRMGLETNPGPFDLSFE
jgi:hypothetical protein